MATNARRNHECTDDDHIVALGQDAEGGVHEWDKEAHTVTVYDPITADPTHEQDLGEYTIAHWIQFVAGRRGWAERWTITGVEVFGALEEARE